MKRVRASALVAAASLSMPAAALGDTITEAVGFSSNSNIGLYSVMGPMFNPALGTLTGVSISVSGTYSANIVTAATSPDPASVLGYDWSVTGDRNIGSVGTFGLIADGNSLTGSPEAFNFSTGVLPAPDDQYYLGAPPFTTGLLINVDVFSNPAVTGSWGSPYDDNSAFSGVVEATYTYTVPEPGTLALLAIGIACCSIAGFSRRRVPVLQRAV
jgi:hypothetical protein